MRRAGGGFTLLEVVVALAILSVAIVAGIQGFAQGLRLLKLAGEHQDAILLADQLLTEVVTPTAGTEERSQGAFTWDRTTKLLEAPDLAPPGTPATWRAYEITVHVRWGDHRQIELATLRTVPITLEKPADKPR